MKYQVLTTARGRCECFGAHEHQRALEVDHILPRNQGGSDAITNLQALCFRCKTGKRDGCLSTQEGASTSAVCRPATATAKRAVCSARWGQRLGAAGE
ncbi:HNH endonuclease [Cyanobium gracile]|uniref:HNH endonuclease n=1 Tax=Cyanobium gracile TaxID=59930 RepID=UPI003A4C6B50